MKIKFWLLITLALLPLLVPTPAYAAQEGVSLQLGLVRNYGYGGLGKIQGNFTLRISGPPPGLDAVQFYIDGELVGEATQEPFLYKFHTSSYADGEREMYAVGIFADGRSLESNHISKIFLSSDQAFGETRQIIAPILIAVGVLSLLGVGVPLLANRNQKFVLGKYGPAGGVVCPRCALPFSRTIMAPNLVAGKLVRCPHCGKLAILPRASNALLKEAEARYLQKDDPGVKREGKEDLKKQLDDSRFDL